MNGIVVAAVCLTLALGLHRSASPKVLGMWSPGYAALLTAALAGTLILMYLLRSRRRWTLLDFAAGALGVAYLTSAIYDTGSPARALNLHLLGSTVIPALMLEWAALVIVLAAGLVRIPHLPPRLVNPAFAVAAVAVTMVALEGAARAVAIMRPRIQGFPTARAVIWHKRHVELNAAGFRGAEPPLESRPGTKRLLVVGDSYAFGAGLNSTEDRFGDRLAQGLTRATDHSWEVVDAARQDTHTLHHLEFLEYGLRYGPDLVVLLYVFNDIEYLSRPPRNKLAENPRSVRALLSPVRIAYLNSYLAQEVYVRVRHLAYSRAELPDPYADPHLVAAHVTDLRRFVDRATSTGSAAIIVPFEVEVAVSEYALNRFRRFLGALEEAGLPVLAVETFPDIPLTVNRLDRHPSAQAHEWLAEVVLARMVQE